MGVCVFFFQAEDGIRDLVRSRGLGDVYKRQGEASDAEGVGHRPVQYPIYEKGRDRYEEEPLLLLSLIHI